MTGITADGDYQRRLSTESKKWGDHLEVEAAGEWNAWLDHPLISEHYKQRALIGGLPWEHWVKQELGGPAQKSLDLGCGAAARSAAVFHAGASLCLHGIDLSPDRISKGRKTLAELGAPASLQVADINSLSLPENTYDLIFSCHSFHHFLQLEHIMGEVHRALTPRGFFILEEYVGPTQLQWTDHQMHLVRSLLSLIPSRLRTYRTGVLKNEEARPTPEQVVAVSPFESIRSGEIFSQFNRHFEVVLIRRLGGTIQHLLYNGIAHNFRLNDPDAAGYVETILRTEDALIDGDLLPSDFMLLVGRRRDAPHKAAIGQDEMIGALRSRVMDLEREVKTLYGRVAGNEQTILALRTQVVEKENAALTLSDQLAQKEGELKRLTGTLGWRLLSKFGPIKYRFLLPAYRALFGRSRQKDTGE